MSTPNVPLKIEFSIELPGTPEQVWHAIATGPGMTAWFTACEVDEREGGAYVVHMGETASHGTVSGWEPPHRFVTEEPEWAEFTGHEGAAVTPLVTEYLVEAQSGGTCVLRVVSSAFGTGADWEREFLGEAERYWLPAFEHLRLYLTNFPGQQATPMEAGSDVKGELAEILAAARAALGAGTAGDRIDVHGLGGEVHRITDVGFIVRLVEPECGYLSFYVFPTGDGAARANVNGFFFGGDAAELSARQQKSWSEWFDRLPEVLG